MSKYTYKPNVVKFSLLILLSIGVLYTCTLSTYVSTKNDNIFSIITNASHSVLISSGIYVTITGLQYTYFELCRAYVSFKYKDQPHAMGSPRNDETNRYTVMSLMVNSMQFENIGRTRSIFVSRAEMWFVFYTIPLAIWVVFAVIPVYDSALTMAFCIGLFAKGMYEETRKDHFWMRPLYRRILHVVICISGVVSFTMMFVMCVVLSNSATNLGLQKKDHATTLLDYSANMSFNTSGLDSVQHIHTHTNATAHINLDLSMATVNNENVSDIIQRYYENKAIFDVYGDPVLAQYLYWHVNSYLRLMTLPVLFSLVSPLFICKMPESMSIPVLLEIAQVPVTSIAGMLMCVSSIVTRTIPFSLLKSSTAIGDLYFITSGIATWFCVFLVFVFIRDRNTSSLAYVISPFALFKVGWVHADVIQSTDLNVIFSIVVVFFVVYFVLSISFDRSENIAIRMGWGVESEEDEYESMYDDTHTVLKNETVCNDVNKEHRPVDDPA